MYHIRFNNDEWKKFGTYTQAYKFYNECIGNGIPAQFDYPYNTR